VRSVGGRLLTVRIPVTASGYRARPAQLYLPPRVVADPHARVPLLELFHGTPGSPTDWLTRGHLLRTLDAFAAAHGGTAPITVLPDINGTRWADTACVRSPAGRVEHYLAVDVPDWVASRYPVTPQGRTWTVAGISEGGTCSAMLGLRYSSTFGVLGDFSGRARPSLKPSHDPATAIRVLFGGSRQAYNRHDPPWLLRHHRYPRLSGWFSYGDHERVVGAEEQWVATLARKAGMTVHSEQVPGGHTWATWSAVLPRFLTWMWARIHSPQPAAR
jgi:enterochelin esterase-like enzyme